ncbi:endopeptidase La [Candidatus Dependentiae bacterium]|nr:endopeptidase La [Candidatus Dependentiae bacterium]MBU4387429.1 endopeptidase La [Candidatus Dependentiae bacterium]
MESVKDQKVKFLPVLPLKNMVALPKSIIPVVVGRDISINAVKFAAENNKEIFVSAQKLENVDNPGVADLFKIGTKANILQIARMPNGTFKILIEGICRSEIQSEQQAEGFLGVIAKDMTAEKDLEPASLSAMWRNLFETFKIYVSLNSKISEEILAMFKGPQDLDYLTDTIAVQLPLSFHQRQEILELVDLEKRSIHLSVLLEKEIAVLETEQKIKKRVQRQIDKNQKDYYLNEQMRAIQRELGRQDYQQEIDSLRQQIKKTKLSKEALDKVESEIKRLESMQPTSPEAVVSRNYIDWILGLPWNVSTKDNVSLNEAENILNKSHAAMKKAKERIIEFLAAKKFAGNDLKKAPIVCLAGPPGVGKTSLALSIADSLGRKLVRISLGGMRDEAEIRGHRRTYIGAMPGKIIQAMKKAGVTNPVIVLDEIDKMAMDFRGDPASALLEVLDPEQNSVFSDYFLEIDYDLSNVMFITTANVVDNIPYPLLDRMEIIGLNGYTTAEKLKIAQDFLLPKLFKEHALKVAQVKIDENIVLKVIEEYTKEAGVRQLERVLAKLIRKSIQLLLKDKNLKTVTVDHESVISWLGRPKFKLPDRTKLKDVGRVTGLAWTEVGGDVLDVEVVTLKGKGALTLTGQLGEVMQESAQAAMTYIRSRAKDLGLKPDFYSELDIHIHVPEGAIPKDGPSAGITIGTAIASALTGIHVDKNVAMTGEITLQGRVLPVGGLKEKLLAAARLGITKVIVSNENEDDIKEFEKELDNKLNVVYVDNMDDVLKNSFSVDPFEKAKMDGKNLTKNKSKKNLKKSKKRKNKKVKSKR